MIDQQLYIDGVLADISDSTEVTLTHESNLLTGAAEFKSNRSLTISLPATMHNRKLFGYADIVQYDGGVPYDFHDAEYHRNGVPIIQGGQARLLQVTPEELQVCIVWGVRAGVDAMLASGETLNDISTNVAVEFHATPQVDTHAYAITHDIFYAAMDTERHAGENEYYHVKVDIAGREWSNNALSPASSFLHPSVRMTWLIQQLQTKYGVTLDFDDGTNDIATMIVPLVSKVPNDITFNGGYTAHGQEQTTWGGVFGSGFAFTTTNSSAIIAPQNNPPENDLVCVTAFNGLLRFSVYMYLDDLVLVSYPIYRSKYGYALEIGVNGVFTTCVIIPENSYFMAQDRDSNGRIGFTINGSSPISMNVGDRLVMRVAKIDQGVISNISVDGIHVYGGTIWINEIIGSVNEVQPTQQFPVQGNLPNIKPVDLIKFLCAVTGVFPVQASTDTMLSMRPVADVFDWNNAVDWSEFLLSPVDEPIAADTTYTPDGWAKKNWWKWKQDDTVLGSHDGSIDVDDETVEEERDIYVFPFAASDGNNIPMYTSEREWDADSQTWKTEIKWHKVEPRVMHLTEDDNGDAVADFDYDIANIITNHYMDLAATMERPVVIKETFRMTDVMFMRLDETRPVYLAQHNAYFALLSCELHQDGTAKATLLRLKKMEEI